MDEPKSEHYDLNELKRQIDNEIRPLIGRLQNPLDRFNAYMSLLRDNWSDDLAYKAFHEAKQIQKADDKVYSLQSLSSELYYHTNGYGNQHQSAAEEPEDNASNT